MANTLRGLLPDGRLPSAARDEVAELARQNGLPPGAIPVFSSLLEAREWEAENPGRAALYVGEGSVMPDPGTNPGTPPPAGGVTDFVYQWLGSDMVDSGSGWPARKGGITLPYVPFGSLTAVRSGLGVQFSGGYIYNSTGFGPVALSTITEPYTIVVAHKHAADHMGFPVGLNQSMTASVASPGGGLSQAGIYTNAGNAVTPTANATSQIIDGVVVTARFDGASSSITAGTEVRAASNIPKPIPVTDFNIGASYGQPNGGYVGTIYEVRVYNRRLTDTEVTQVHESLASTYGLVL